MNSCQNYTLYIDQHILLNILSMTTSNMKESRKSIKKIEKITRFDLKKTKSIVSCYHMNHYLQKL